MNNTNKSAILINNLDNSFKEQKSLFNWEINSSWENEDFIITSIKDCIKNKGSYENSYIINTPNLLSLLELLQLIPKHLFTDKEFLLKAIENNFDFFSALIEYTVLEDNLQNPIYANALCIILENLPLYHFINFKDFWNFSLKTLYLYLHTPKEIIEQRADSIEINLEKFEQQTIYFNNVIHCIDNLFINGKALNHLKSILQQDKKINTSIPSYLFNINSEKQFIEYILDTIYSCNISVVGSYNPRMLYVYLPERYKLAFASTYTGFIKEHSNDRKNETNLLEFYQADAIPIEYYYEDNLKCLQLSGERGFFYLHYFLSRIYINKDRFIFSNDFDKKFIKTFFNENNVICNIKNLCAYIQENYNYIKQETPDYYKKIFQVIMEQFLLPFKNNKDIVTKFLKLNCWAFRYYSFKEFMLSLPDNIRNDYFIKKYALQHINIIDVDNSFNFDFSTLNINDDLLWIQDIVTNNKILNNPLFNSVYSTWIAIPEIISYSSEVVTGDIVLTKEQWLNIISNKDIFNRLIKENPDYFNYIPDNILDNKDWILLFKRKIELNQNIPNEHNVDYSFYLKKINNNFKQSEFFLDLMKSKYHVPEEFLSSFWNDYNFSLKVFQLLDSNLYSFEYLPKHIQLFFKSYNIKSNYSESFSQIHLQKKINTAIINKNIKQAKEKKKTKI